MKICCFEREENGQQTGECCANMATGNTLYESLRRRKQHESYDHNSMRQCSV